MKGGRYQSYRLKTSQNAVDKMVQTSVRIVEMFGLGSLHTPRRVLGVLLLQRGQTEGGGEEGDESDLHGVCL